MNATATIISMGSGGLTIYLLLRKNGSALRQHSHLINYTSSYNQTMEIDTIVYLNGSTDFLDATFSLNNGGTTSILGGPINTHFSANFVHE